MISQETVTVESLGTRKDAIFTAIRETCHQNWALGEREKRAAGNADAGWRSAAKVGSLAGDKEWMDGALAEPFSPIVRRTANGPEFDMAAIEKVRDLPPTWQMKNNGVAELVYGLIESSVRAREPLTTVDTLVKVGCAIHDAWLKQPWNKPADEIQAMTGEMWRPILADPTHPNFRAVAAELRKDLPNFVRGASIALGREDLGGELLERFDRSFGLDRK